MTSQPKLALLAITSCTIGAIIAIACLKRRPVSFPCSRKHTNRRNGAARPHHYKATDGTLLVADPIRGGYARRDCPPPMPGKGSGHRVARDVPVEMLEGFDLGEFEHVIPPHGTQTIHSFHFRHADGTEVSLRDEFADIYWLPDDFQSGFPDRLRWLDGLGWTSEVRDALADVIRETRRASKRPFEIYEKDGQEFVRGDLEVQAAWQRYREAQAFEIAQRGQPEADCG